MKPQNILSLNNSRGSRVAGRGSKVAVADPHFSVNAPLSICEQFVDKKKTMVTYGNFFIRYCYA